MIKDLGKNLEKFIVSRILFHPMKMKKAEAVRPSQVVLPNHLFFKLYTIPKITPNKQSTSRIH